MQGPGAWDRRHVDRLRVDRLRVGPSRGPSPCGPPPNRAALRSSVATSDPTLMVAAPCRRWRQAQASATSPATTKARRHAVAGLAVVQHAVDQHLPLRAVAGRHRQHPVAAQVRSRPSSRRRPRRCSRRSRVSPGRCAGRTGATGHRPPAAGWTPASGRPGRSCHPRAHSRSHLRGCATGFWSASAGTRLPASYSIGCPRHCVPGVPRRASFEQAWARCR